MIPNAFGHHDGPPDHAQHLVTTAVIKASSSHHCSADSHLQRRPVDASVPLRVTPRIAAGGHLPLARRQPSQARLRQILPE
jgi:hypothetical protein